MLDSPTHTPFRQMVEAASVGGRSECVQKCWRPVKVSKCVESETMRLFRHVVARWGVDRSVFVKDDIVGVSPTQPVLGNLLGTLILGVFKLEMKRWQETGMTTTPKDRWLLVVLWDMFGLKVVRSIWSFLYSCIRKSYKGQLDVKVFPRSWGLLCYSNPESPFFFSLWGFTPQHLISVSCTRSTFCPRGSEWMTTVVFSSLCKLVNPAALFI